MQQILKPLPLKFWESLTPAQKKPPDAPSPGLGTPLHPTLIAHQDESDKSKFMLVFRTNGVP
uniref:Uncharacterized protein n=1 Tax=Romanomermis culicivorax TaxID=13658 RepID=A0A915I6J0_ROMCU